MAINIRRAVPADADKVLDLLLQVEGVHQKGRPDLFRENGVKFTKEELYEIFADDLRPVFVAEADGAVCGYVFGIINETKDSTMLFDMKTIHLEDVCIDESCRGMGIGGALMEYVTAWAKENGCNRMDLDVWEFNEGARRFYERYGFGTQKRRMDKWI
ncbi:MAG: GNAT family N-acetyltransferase [Ruminococcaceae bacterium]|nr:GNAT family N-acetyltransferase [Oscillospiraceae bacterium]